jgi:hypothetical protein
MNLEGRKTFQKVMSTSLAHVAQVAFYLAMSRPGRPESKVIEVEDVELAFRLRFPRVDMYAPPDPQLIPAQEHVKRMTMYRTWRRTRQHPGANT